jgi:hypothetical protein
VAENYWQNKDVQQARTALAGWEAEALSLFLSMMEQRAPSQEARQHLVALREALAIAEPDAPASLLALLLRDRVVIGSALLSGLPLIAAAIVALSPHIRRLIVLSREWWTRARLASRRPAEEREAEASAISIPEALAQAEGPLTAEDALTEGQQTPVRQVGLQQALEQHGSPHRDPELGEQQAVQSDMALPQALDENAIVRAAQEPVASPEQIQDVSTQPPIQPIEGPETAGQAASHEVQRLQQPQEEQVTLARDWVAQTREQLLELQEQLPQMTQPVEQVLERLLQTQAKIDQMSPTDLQAEMRQIQAQLGRMQQEAVQEVPPEAQSQLAQMHQMTDIMAQAMTRAIVQIQQQPVVQSPPTEPQTIEPSPAEESSESEDPLDDLEDLDLTEEGLADLFEIEEAQDPSIEALGRGLDEIDVSDLLGNCRDVSLRLRKHNRVPAAMLH